MTSVQTQHRTSGYKGTHTGVQWCVHTNIETNKCQQILLTFITYDQINNCLELPQYMINIVQVLYHTRHDIKKSNHR